ncbi:MAG TPA: ribonuclease III [Candidatus Hydrogenedentes bacterium]|nr:ribonuclease III [Candidatus Hydrogenedentota bacterium]HOV72884.1 ribonuclease III [Candidatus Hydrogenedentota bacterium]HPC16421.1 ribonuclease III [Candidatus Hydrogenedentota bacterium]HRT20354.1 ribonuclease III [Candidatus Hydrogenedentota bacterium]HRT65080.1 ribonuclease III [Candidatus Hydrogenedentota bacterium]
MAQPRLTGDWDTGMSPPVSADANDSVRADQLRALAERIGMPIKDYVLLNRALTHASVSAETTERIHNYESLEFLGDAVLGLAIAHCLYERIPDRTPGEYSRIRAGVVNRRCLAQIARRLGIASAIRLGKGEELAGGRQRASLLADCLEAMIGALFLDRGWAAALEFVARVFEPELVRELASDRIWDFKSRLQNYCQGRHLPLPVFTIVQSEGPDHRKQFEVEVSLGGEPAGRGRGLSKKEAEQNAARAALAREGLDTG